MDCTNKTKYYLDLLNEDSYRNAITKVKNNHKDNIPPKTYFGQKSYLNKQADYNENKDNSDHKIKRPTINNKTFFGYHLHHIEEDTHPSLSSSEICFKKIMILNFKRNVI